MSQYQGVSGGFFTRHQWTLAGGFLSGSMVGASIYNDYRVKNLSRWGLAPHPTLLAGQWIAL